MASHAIESLKRSVAGVTEAGKAALEARISTLKYERQQLEPELARELAAAGNTPQNIMERPSLNIDMSLAS